MLIYNLTTTTDDNGRVRDEIVHALGMTSPHADPKWPPPNAKKSDEKSFWGWATSYTWRADVWCGHIHINDEWATLRLYYIGHSMFIDGGFAVLVFREYQKERVEYWEWRACDHVFKSKNIGRCLNRYTCEKCHKSYEVDSSD